MFDLRKYKIGLDPWGLCLTLLIMLPNFIWFAVPAPQDVLRSASGTPAIDTAASVFQVFLVAGLCGLRNTDACKPARKKMLAGIGMAVAAYWLGWICYYGGIANASLILLLCVAPCVACFLLSLERKNAPAAGAAILFMAFHAASAISNFVA